MNRARLAVVASLFLFPVPISAQSLDWPEQMQAATAYCLQNTGPECDAAVSAVLEELTLEGHPAQPLSDFAALFALAADPTLPAPVRAAMARALTLIANATADTGLRAQILAIAALVASGESLQLEANRLLASPN